jgi:hypothetical protein
MEERSDLASGSKVIYGLGTLVWIDGQGHVVGVEKHPYVAARVKEHQHNSNRKEQDISKRLG